MKTYSTAFLSAGRSSMIHMTTNNEEARAQFVDLAEWLASWSWPLDEESAKRLPAQRGWTLLDDNPGHGSTWDAGLIEQRSWASFRVMDGVLDDVNIVTARFAQDYPGVERLITDSFADQVEAVTEVLGKPRERKPGREGSALWDLPSGAMLYVGRDEDSSSWEFTSPAYAKVQRDLGR